MNGVVILWKTKTIEMMDKDSTLFFPLSLLFSQLHLHFSYGVSYLAFSCMEITFLWYNAATVAKSARHNLALC